MTTDKDKAKQAIDTAAADKAKLGAKIEGAAETVGEKLKGAAEAVSDKIKDAGVAVKDIGSHIKHKLER